MVNQKDGACGVNRFFSWLFMVEKICENMWKDHVMGNIKKNNVESRSSDMC